MIRLAQRLTLISKTQDQSSVGRIVMALMGILLAVLAVHVGSAYLDFLASIRLPLELDYGEGIVWQQAALIPGPRMYSTSTALPFIVFHYPPLYYFLARVALLVEPNFLAAGRLVSVLSTLLMVPAITSLVLLSIRHPGRRIADIEICCAVAAGLLALCLPTIHSWGLVMRVDMLAVTLSMIGLMLGIWAEGKFAGTTLALLVCLAAVFTKQTQLPAGIAVVVIASLRRPRMTLAAAALVGVIGLVGLGFMEWETGSGFLRNIVGFNINRFALENILLVFTTEVSSFMIFGLMLASGALILLTLPGQVLSGSVWDNVRQCTTDLRLGSRVMLARGMLLIYSLLSGLMLVAGFKSGGASNYLLPCLSIGCVLIGVLLCDLSRDKRQMVAGLSLLLLCIQPLPFRLKTDLVAESELQQQATLVQAIALAKGPVASENMTLLMQAGKSVVYEPAIVTELALVGRWDETPLVNMIRAGGFAFMITTSEFRGASVRRTAAVDAAMWEAYPKLQKVSQRLWLHLPPDR